MSDGADDALDRAATDEEHRIDSSCNGEDLEEDFVPGPLPEYRGKIDRFRQAYGGKSKLNLAWVSIGLWEGVVIVNKNSITQFYGDRMSPIPKEMIILERLSSEGITRDRECVNIATKLAKLFGDKSMEDLDAADFKDKAAEIFELVLQSREAL